MEEIVSILQKDRTMFVNILEAYCLMKKSKKIPNYKKKELIIAAFDLCIQHQDEPLKSVLLAVKDQVPELIEFIHQMKKRKGCCK